MFVISFRQRAVALAIALFCGSWSQRSLACPQFVESTEGQTLLPPSSCITCHTTPTGGPRNFFGKAWCPTCRNAGATDCGSNDATAAGCSTAGVAWLSCSMVASGNGVFGNTDADGDGLTNYDELQGASNPGERNECVNQPCDPLAICNEPSPTLGDFTCTCPENYAGDGLVAGSGCQDIDECQTGNDDCTDENSSCENIPGSFRCPCDEGFLGSGKEGLGCTQDNPCDPNPCHPLSVCFPRTAGFDCRSCPADSTGNPIDCAACPPGYSGSGVGAQGCGDVNECSQSDCAAGSACANRIGGRTCEACPVGFTGTGVGPNGCVSNVCAECSPYASCDPERAVPCVCNLGFSGPPGTDGKICEDVDECERNLDSCGPNSTCRNLVGSYLCACNAGYAAQGDQCVLSTCSTWGQNCGEIGLCDDTAGAPRCVCAAGLSGTYPNCVTDKATSVASTSGASSCATALGARHTLPWLPASALFLLGAWRRRSRRRASTRPGRRSAAIGVTLMLLAACGDSDGPRSSGGAGGGAGGGGTAGAGGDGPAAMAGSAGNGGTEPNPSGGTAGATPTVVEGGPPSVVTCSHSRECEIDEWCNPATKACDARSSSGEPVTFRGDVFNILNSVGCPVCHTPGERGDIDPSGSGANLLLNELQRGYASLIAGGVNCQGGARRLCVDDPASSRLILQVMAGQSPNQESVAFFEWSEPRLQTLLRWIATGAPRDLLCGNFVRDPGEACDEGPTPATRCRYGVASCSLCNTNCQLVSAGAGPSCGDGVLDVARETCDPASLVSQEAGPFGNAVCGADCTFVTP